MSGEGETSFRLAQKYALTAVQKLEDGAPEEADLYVRLADVQARLAQAAAVVLTTTGGQATGYRILAGGMDL
jgi:hypothetical protein